jgi:hypothetical protein
MSAMHADRIVDDYLRRLEAAAAHLQRSRRAELVAEIREHIDAALRQEEAASEVAIRNVLERLGPPEEIVDAAEPPPAPEPKRRAGVLEVATLLALLVPLIGWLVGMVLVFVSAAWERRDKLIGLGLLLFFVLVPFLLTIAVGADSGAEERVPVGDARPAGLKQESGDTTDVVVLSTFGLLAGLPSALFLGWRLRRHAAASGEATTS